MSAQVSSAQRSANTVLRVIIAVIIAVVINAALMVALAFTIQNNYDRQVAAQRTEGLQTVQSICTTLASLHADNPPTGPEPSRVYLQDLHTRLGDLTSDLKC